MKVSLITTVKDAREEVGRFLASLGRQTRTPDEVVVVDGGSTDGTLEVLRSAEGITLLEEPGANIARGRNVAISAVTHDVIAVTDADCELDGSWLELLLEPIERLGADVAMGASVPADDGFLQRCMAAVNLPDPAELDERTFMPSSRSIAFTRAAFDAAGGYPEWLEIGEDMHLDHRFRQLGLQMRLVPEATVRWHLRPDLRSTWIQYFRYARGDALARMHPERNALRLGVYGAALAAWGSRGAPRKLATLAGGAAYASGPLRRVRRRFADPAERAAAYAAVPALMAFTDVAKMAGYVAGLARRRGQSYS